VGGLGARDEPPQPLDGVADEGLAASELGKRVGSHPATDEGRRTGVEVCLVENRELLVGLEDALGW
jgi:hypothetical protein